MSLILEIAAGILLAMGLLKLPKVLTIYRRQKVRSFYFHMSYEDAMAHALNAELYTEPQRALLLNLAVLAAKGDRSEQLKIATELSHSFAEK
jgi:hypothetical protein